jgi:hypothetical protein
VTVLCDDSAPSVEAQTHERFAGGSDGRLVRLAAAVLRRSPPAVTPDLTAAMTELVVSEILVLAALMIVAKS